MKKLVVAALLTVVWAGCGNINANPIVDMGIARDEASGPDGGISRKVTGTSSGANQRDCPPERPYDGASCSSSAGQRYSCEYGTNIDATCNTHVDCFSGTWTTSHEPPNCEACPAETTVVEGASCGDAALADPGDASVEAGADPDAGPARSDTICAYPKRTCACTTANGAHARQWVCVDTPSDCPTARPMEGAACSTAQTCDYGGCLTNLGLTMTCLVTSWSVATVSCH